MFELFMYVYSCNALLARFFAVDTLNSYFMIMIMIMMLITTHRHTIVQETRPTLLTTTGCQLLWSIILVYCIQPHFPQISFDLSHCTRSLLNCFLTDVKTYTDHRVKHMNCSCKHCNVATAVLITIYTLG